MSGNREQVKKVLKVLTFYFLINPLLFGQTNSTESADSLNNKSENILPHLTHRQFNTGNIHQLGAALQGLDPGLWTPQSSADPNLENNYRIRGLSSLGNTTYENLNPTISLLGFKGLSLADIDPFFVEQVAVIKDGSLARYGVQGGLGVIDLQPVQGKGKNQVFFRSFLSSEMEIDNDPVLSASEFRNVAFPDEGANTNWREEIGQNGQSWVNQLGFSGNQKNVDYYVGVSHRDLRGIQRQTGFDQTNGFLNIGAAFFNDLLKVRAIGMHSITNRELGFASVYEFADRFNPTAPIRLSNGDYNQPQVFGLFNPVAMIDENKRETEATRSLGLVMADLSFGEWTWKNQAGIFVEDVTGQFSSTGISTFTAFFLGSNTDSEREVRSLQSQLQHQKQFGSVWLNTSIGAESQEFIQSGRSEFQYAEGTDDFFTKHAVQLMAYFANVNFTSGDLKGRFDFRREGSSALSNSQQWNNYFSSSLRYNFSDLESFSLFEVFASFGTSGMTPFQSGLTKRLVSERDAPNPPIINQNPTDELSQMSSSHFDMGLSVAPKRGKWRATANFFTNRTSDFWVQQYDPNTLNFNTWANTAELRTSGLEIMADASVKLGAIDWNIRGVFSTQQTRIEDAGLINGFAYSNPEFGCGSGLIHRIQTGDDFGNFYGPRFSRFSAANPGTLTWELEDVNGDGFISDEDDQIIGNAMPDWTLGLQQQFDWKRFTLNLNFQGMFGHDIVNFRGLHTVPTTAGFNVRTSRIESELRLIEEFNPWSSYYVENGSFLRLQVVTLQYQVPVKAKWINDLNVYFTGNNLVTITGYDGNTSLQLANNSNLDGTPGITPQITQWTPGIDRHDAWPHSKSITFGINAKF